MAREQYWCAYNTIFWLIWVVGYGVVGWGVWGVWGGRKMILG